MATTTQAKKKRLVELTGEELGKLFALVSKSDSVELKVTVPLDAQRGTIAALGLDPLDAQIRQVFFFDTPDLQLNRAGIAVRARRVQGRSGDTVVKLRPVVPDQLPEGVRHSPNMKVEVDAMPGGYVCSASMRGKARNDEIHAAVHGQRPLRKLFSKEQRAFYAAHAPDGPALDELHVLGPIFVLKEVVVPPNYGRKVTAEIWLLPDGTRIAELSTKCAPADAFEVGTATRAHLERTGLDLEAEAQTKTKAALEFFAADLKPPRAPRKRRTAPRS
jgi:hypothetical protein